LELARISRERAVDAVYKALRQAILGSLIRSGERLNVEELARKLGVSLTPVRHAIQQLATEGLVEVRPRGGTFVASLTPQDVEETFDLRCALECLAAERAMRRITPQDLRHLGQILESLRMPVRTEEDQKNHERANVEFHMVLIRAAGNRRLLEMYEALNAHIKIARIHASDADWPTRLQEEQSEHEAIVSALENKRTAELVQALRKHIYRARDSLMAAIKENSLSAQRNPE